MSSALFRSLLVMAALFGLFMHQAYAGDVVDADQLINQLEKQPEPEYSPSRSFVVVDETKPQAAPPSATIRVYFTSGTTDIADQRSWDQLDELGKALSSKALKGSRMEIGGHTDSVGSDAYNLALSQKRAQAIATYLYKRYGVSDVTTRGYGESDPVADNGTPDGRALNRRVVIKRLD